MTVGSPSLVTSLSTSSASRMKIGWGERLGTRLRVLAVERQLLNGGYQPYIVVFLSGVS